MGTKDGGPAGSEAKRAAWTHYLTLSQETSVYGAQGSMQPQGTTWVSGWCGLTVCAELANPMEGALASPCRWFH